MDLRVQDLPESARINPVTEGKLPITDAEKAALDKHAQCMRDHGEPNYPDPTFPASGGIYLGQTPNSNTPAFKNAEKSCGSGS